MRASASLVPARGCPRATRSSAHFLVIAGTSFDKAPARYHPVANGGDLPLRDPPQHLPDDNNITKSEFLVGEHGPSLVPVSAKLTIGILLKGAE